jgi:hypothetical protein
MTTLKGAVLFTGALCLAACSATYMAQPQLHYYHGENVPEGYIRVLRATPEEIEFQIRVEFVEKKLYHLVLDGDNPVAEGWFSTLRAGAQSYKVIMKPLQGLAFEPGKTYRLCVGRQNPQEVQLRSNNYQCLVDHTFVFQAKF